MYKAVKLELLYSGCTHRQDMNLNEFTFSLHECSVELIQVGVISLGTTSQDGNMRQVKVEVLGVMDPENKLIRLRAVEPIQVCKVFIFGLEVRNSLYISPPNKGLCPGL